MFFFFFYVCLFCPIYVFTTNLPTECRWKLASGYKTCRFTCKCLLIWLVMTLNKYIWIWTRLIDRTLALSCGVDWSGEYFLSHTVLSIFTPTAVEKKSWEVWTFKIRAACLTWLYHKCMQCQKLIDRVYLSCLETPQQHNQLSQNTLSIIQKCCHEMNHSTRYDLNSQFHVTTWCHISHPSWTRTPGMLRN